VFVAGGTGYVRRPLIARLLDRGHRLRALVRPGSEVRLPPGCEVVAGNALVVGPVPPVAAAAIGAWVGGFDVLYACQDLDFDRAHGLRSIPVRFGVPASLTSAMRPPSLS